MRYLILISVLFLSNVANSKCHVTSELDQKGNKLIQCTKGFTPKTRIANAPLDDKGEVLKYGGFLKERKVSVPDLDNPILTVPKAEPCPDSNCNAQMLDANFCQPDEEKLNGRRTMPPLPLDEGDTEENYPMTTWCSKRVYGTKMETRYEFDQVKKDAADAARAAAEAAKQAAKDAEVPFLEIEKKMACGRRVIAMMAISNESKGLSRAQKKGQKDGMRDAMEFLLLGSLQEAKEEIELIVPDGAVVLQSDKDAALAKLDSCLGV